MSKKRVIMGVGLTLLLTIIGVVITTYPTDKTTVTELESEELFNLEQFSDYQYIDFRESSKYNQGHIEGFIRRESSDIQTSDQLYEQKVLAVGDESTPWEDIIDNLSYLGIKHFSYVKDFDNYQGPRVNLLGSCGDGEGCGFDGSEEGLSDTILQYGIYIGDGLFLNIGGTVESYTGVAVVSGEDFPELEEGVLYRYKTNGIMAMSYPGQMGGSSLTEVVGPVAVGAYSEDLKGSLTSSDFPYDLDIQVINADEPTHNFVDDSTVNKEGIYIIDSPSNNRIAIELTALQVLEAGANIVIKSVYDPSNPYERVPLTVEDAGLFLELQYNSNVHLWDVRNQGYKEGHVKGFKEIPQSEIQNTQFSDDDARDVYIIYCKTGGVTAEVRDELAQKGVYNVIDLGGLTGANVDLVQE